MTNDDMSCHNSCRILKYRLQLGLPPIAVSHCSTGSLIRRKIGYPTISYVHNYVDIRSDSTKSEINFNSKCKYVLGCRIYM